MNSMKKRFITCGIIFLIVINISALFTLAYNRWFKVPPAYLPSGSGDTLAAAQARLSLNDEQLQQMKTQRVAFEAEIEEIQIKMQDKRKALVEEMKNATPDSALIGKLIDEIGHLQAQVQKEAVRRLFKEKQLLTPEQQEKFFKMFEDHVCPRGIGHRHSSLGREGFCWPQDNEKESGFFRNPINKEIIK
jgi:Spy/CpxP family protein refolding chaperone